MKVYIKYDEGTEMEIKLKLPKKWTTGPLLNLKDTFVEAYNKKHAESPLDLSNLHFINKSGEALADEEIVEGAFKDGDKLVLLSGKPPAYVEKKVEESKISSTVVVEEEKKENQLRCKNYGCQKFFSEEDNSENSCNHHVAPPLFHDTRKGWSCCKDTMVYDWDEFQQIPPCAKGRHSTVDPKLTFAASPSAQGSSTTNTESKTNGSQVKVKSIEEYNEKNPEAITAAASALKTVTNAPKKFEPREDGMAKCVHKGCQILYDPNANSSKSCTYHPGNAVFHDAKKYWSCCEGKGKTAYDFDEFLAIPGCAIGAHAHAGEVE